MLRFFCCCGGAGLLWERGTVTTRSTLTKDEEKEIYRLTDKWSAIRVL